MKKQVTTMMVLAMLASAAAVVWEWCQDWYGPYENKDQKDPTGPAAGEKKVVRGGSCLPWFSDNEEFLSESVHPFCRSAARYSFAPTIRCLITTGFRVVLAPEMEGKK